LLRRTHRTDDDLFLTRAERVALAYKEQAMKVGFSDHDAAV
jgi:hypothetical protein